MTPQYRQLVQVLCRRSAPRAGRVTRIWQPRSTRKLGKPIAAPKRYKASLIPSSASCAARADSHFPGSTMHISLPLAKQWFRKVTHRLR